jgi:hypothetical protein
MPRTNGATIEKWVPSIRQWVLRDGKSTPEVRRVLQGLTGHLYAMTTITRILRGDQYAHMGGPIRAGRKYHKPAPSLTHRQVLAMRRRYFAGEERIADICKAYGKHNSHYISRVMRGLERTDVPMPPEANGSTRIRRYPRAGWGAGAALGEYNHNATLNWVAVDLIRILWRHELWTQKELAEVFRTTGENISQICNNKRWKVHPDELP